ncbi:MAG: hypothetical protein DRI48_07915 [Chloroflexi bacterium]|nr:MAG: hypothetical protein DRI48_07915 [Chloroflexota bacterium]
MFREIMEQLRQIPLFAKLKRDDLAAVAKLVKREEYRPGDVVCRQGEAGDFMYVVEKGELQILQVDSQGVEREVSRLGPGEYFGETSLLLGEPRDATVRVTQEASLLSLNKDEFESLLDRRSRVFDDLQLRSDVRRKLRARRSRFKWLDSDEVVVLRERRHAVIMIRVLTLPCFALLVVLVGSLYWYRTSGTMLALVAGAVLSFVLLVVIAFLVADSRDERYIVTNKRVVRREHTPLGRESRVDAPLRTIQNIQESQIGLLAQLYDFGDLIIETAGERGHVAFREIPNPEGVRDIIFEQVRRLKSEAKVAERMAIRRDLQQYFEVQAREKEAAEPPPPPKRRLRPTLSAWLSAPLRALSYFLPPLRYEHGETVTWRKHWIALLKPIAIPTLLLILATGVVIYLLFRTPVNWVPTLVGYGVALVILLPWWLWEFDDWQNDIYQVTSTRIIDVERLPFYMREDRREASLGMIQNVKFEIPSTLARFLNYGSVTIETAGVGAFTFDCVKDPRGVQGEIFRRMEAFQKQQAKMEAERHRSELLDWFAVYDQVRGSTSSPPESSSSPPSPPSPPQET